MSSRCVRVQGSGCRVQGSGLRVQGAGFRVQGSGSRVQGGGLKAEHTVSGAAESSTERRLSFAEVVFLGCTGEWYSPTCSEEDSCFRLIDCCITGSMLEMRQRRRRFSHLFREGLVLKAHRLLYHSALGSRVITKKQKKSVE